MHQMNKSPVIYTSCRSYFILNNGKRVEIYHFYFDVVAY